MVWSKRSPDSGTWFSSSRRCTSVQAVDDFDREFAAVVDSMSRVYLYGGVFMISSEARLLALI